MYTNQKVSNKRGNVQRRRGISVPGRRRRGRVPAAEDGVVLRGATRWC